MIGTRQNVITIKIESLSNLDHNNGDKEIIEEWERLPNVSRAKLMSLKGLVYCLNQYNQFSTL